MTADGVANLTSLRRLERLHVSGRLHDTTFEWLLPLRGQLKHFAMFTSATSTSPPTSRAYEHLAQFARLEEIGLHGSQGAPTDKDLLRLAGLPLLKKLYVNFGESSDSPDPHVGRRHTPAGIDAFRNARPDVELHIDGQIYPASGLPFSVLQKLDETDPLPKWELPEGTPPPVVAPCKPEEAAALQQKWAEHLKRQVVEEVAAPAGLGLKFALIPPGEFRKIFTRPRDPAIEPDMLVRRFRITKPYAISTTEVTWDQFRQFVEATGYQTEAETNGIGGRDRSFQPDPKINWRNPGWKPAPNEPVTQVTPKDAEAFCAWLSKTSNAVYRLPTEAEWVHACRAGSVHKHVVGPEPGDLADYAWNREQILEDRAISPLHAAGQKNANAFGLYDILGNVWEYTHDSWSAPIGPYLHTNNPLGTRSSGLLGSSWENNRTSTHPDWSFPLWDIPTFNVGFRVLKQFDGEPLPGPLDRPLVLRAGQPMSVHALVPRPEKIPGLQSWSIELAGNAGPVAVSPKSDLIVIGSYITGKISVWDRDGNYKQTLLGHEGSIASLDFSADGRWLASCEIMPGGFGHSGVTARIWNIATGALHTVIPLPGWARRVAFSPKGDELAVAHTVGQSFLIFNLTTGRSRSPTESTDCWSLAWSPDGAQIVSSSTNNRLRVWNAATLTVLREVECPVSNSLAWSPDGKWLALGHDGRKVSIRDAKTLEATKTIDTIASSLAWLPDSQRLIVAHPNSPYSGVFNATTGEKLVNFDAGQYYHVALFEGGRQAALAHQEGMHIYDTSTGQKLREGKARGQSGGSTTLTMNCQEVVACLPWSTNRISVFDAATGNVKRTYGTPLASGTARAVPSLDGTLLAISANHPVTHLIDAETGVKRHELSHESFLVTHVEWSPDGKWLATGATDKLVRIWNVGTGKVEYELAGHAGTIRSLAWSPDGIRLASAAEDKTVRLWDPHKGKQVAIYDRFPEEMSFVGDNSRKGIAWTKDSRRLWVALWGQLMPLDIENGKFGPLENFSNGAPTVFLNTSPDGQRLLVRENYGWTFVRGRDAQDRRLLGQRLVGETAHWHPDSRRFLGWEPSYGTVGFDVETNRRLGILFPWLTGDHWLCIGPTGHYRGSPGVEAQIVYVAMLDDGSQRTYTPAEFAAKFNWKNDPEKVELLGK